MTNATERLSLDDKLNLIKSRARLMGFRRHDLEDAVQEVTLAVLEFEYDKQKSNGATETTALTTVIDRRLKLLKRSQRRYAGLLDRAAQHLAVDHKGLDDGPMIDDRSGEELVESEEVTSALYGLDAETLQVAGLLMEGATQNAIAEYLGMGWQRVARLTGLIRARLESAGLNPAVIE